MAGGGLQKGREKILKIPLLDNLYVILFNPYINSYFVRSLLLCLFYENRALLKLTTSPTTIHLVG